MPEHGKNEPSKVETAKRESRHLRGTIARTLASEATHFTEDEVQLLKTHGTYQQDDRDQRRALRDTKQDKSYMFMVRCAIPGGQLTADQYLALDDIADRFANGTLRITTRQGIQFHGVLKNNLKNTIADINRSLITTLAACGDVERNVMACPAPLSDEPRILVRRLAREIAVEMRPATRAYHEIWLDQEKIVSTQSEEPFYGEVYLPRKFKTAISLETDNCVDIYSQDCGLVALARKNSVIGFNVLAGGGLGMTHQKADTFARLAEPVAFIPVDSAIAAVKTVAAIFRDFGNRSDRRHARLKYLIAQWGIDRFIEEFNSRMTGPVAPPEPMAPPQHHDHLGIHAQGNGRHFYGVYIECGRIADRENCRPRAALREIARQVRPAFLLTPQQSILLGDLTDESLDRVLRILADHGVAAADDLSAARRYMLACPALPTCGLAMSESERLMPSVIDRFEAELTALGLRNVPLTLRMTGCPNGCARPYTADIAFVGRRPDVYHVFIGGGLPGDRVTDLFAPDVPTDLLVDVLRPLLTAWSSSRRADTNRADENLSDFYQRLIAHDRPRTSITGAEKPTRELVQLRIGA